MKNICGKKGPVSETSGGKLSNQDRTYVLEKGESNEELVNADGNIQDSFEDEEFVLADALVMLMTKQRKKEITEKDAAEELKMKATEVKKCKRQTLILEEEKHLIPFLELVPEEIWIEIPRCDSNLFLDGDRFDRLDHEEMDSVKNQEEWILRSWNFFENCGVHTLTLEDAESASESAYNLLRFIQNQIDEYGSYDGSEKLLKFETLAIPEQTTTCKEISNLFMAM
ncbi:hypothetical protein Tco_0761539 [Tanacetum coccineum]